jgi:hypothetical protein
MKRCAALTAGGGRCQRIVSDSAVYCFGHDPARAEERKRNAARAGQAGGKGRPASDALTEVRELKAGIRDLIGKLLEGEVSRDVAACAFQGFNAAARMLEQERKVIEQTEIIPRLEALEADEDEEASRRWG